MVVKTSYLWCRAGPCCCVWMRAEHDWRNSLHMLTLLLSHPLSHTLSLCLSLSRRKVGTDNGNWYTKHKHSLPEESLPGVMLWGDRVVFYGAVTVVVQHVSKGESVGYSTTSADCQSKSQSNTRWSKWRTVPEAERGFFVYALYEPYSDIHTLPVSHTCATLSL